jgi:hypothetical protein
MRSLGLAAQAGAEPALYSKVLTHKNSNPKSIKA